MSAAPGPSARQVLEPCPFCGSGIVPSPGLAGTYQHADHVRECIIGDAGILDTAAWNRRAAPDRAAIVEECAKVADRRDDEGEYGHYTAFIARRIAEDIRALCAASLRARAEAPP